LTAHGIRIPATGEGSVDLHKLAASDRKEYSKRFTEAFHRYLDAGYGECVLKRPDLNQIVAKTLRHFDGTRYHLGDFVVMPNHVHLLVCLLGETALDKQCYSWKKFTAREINRWLERKGHFWQAESFDHLVRSPEQFHYFQEYIAHNPVKARLAEETYLLCKM
jgi:REP element-mobilizing transposase RayT